MKYERGKRISEEIKKIVSYLMLTELKDPRIPKLISITQVETTKDLRFAKIYISFIQDDVDVEEALKGLNNAKGFIRKEIGKQIKLHYTPEPIFVLDDSIKNGRHIDNVIKGLDIKNESENSDD